MEPTRSRRPRSILMTADTFGGVWTYALELARELGKRDVGVVLATMGRPLSRDQALEAAELPMLEVFQSAYKLEWMREPWNEVARAGDWLLGLESYCKPDLIHLNGYAHAALPWKARKLVVGHSCVLSWWRAVHHQQAPEEWAVYRQKVAAGLQAAEMVVCPSRAMLSELQQLYGPLRSARVIPNGRTLPTFTPRPKEKIILSAGRLWDEAKNIAALASIASGLPWPVYLAGEARRPEDGSISYTDLCCLGHLPTAKVIPWFSRAAIYCLPAKYEPFGLSVLEAAIAGCALVLGDIPSLREFWNHAALFVPPENPEVLKEALLELISSPVWIASLGAKAKWAAWHFTPERMVEEYLSIYAELTASPGAHAPKSQSKRRLAEGKGHAPGKTAGKAVRTPRRAKPVEELAA